MIKRLINSKLPLIIYNPPNTFDINYFYKIYESGGLPVFDTEFFGNAEIKIIINQLKNKELLFGIRLHITNTEIVDILNRENISNLDLVIFSYFRTNELTDFPFKNNFYNFFIEVPDINIDDQLSFISPNGLILKGNEAPGKVSTYSLFLLLQWYLEYSDIPFFVHGGVGYYTAAGMFAAGANGIVLDNQLYLADEAPVSSGFKKIISGLDVNDSVLLGEDSENHFRVFGKLGTRIVKELKIKKYNRPEEKNGLYDDIKKNHINLSDDMNFLQSLFYLGQDAVFAKHFIKKSSKLKDVIKNLFTAISLALQDIEDHDPMLMNSSLAKEHGVKYPVIQGPMANISDNTDFAQKIMNEGGLPFFALGNLPENLARDILISGNKKMDHFGVGLIGINSVNPSIKKHIKLIKKYKIKFALFAGFTPDQVLELESLGTTTYVHTPSIQMLKNAVEKGIYRFVFEGREAGGHVGTLSSLVLWEQAVIQILEYKDLNRFRLLFAGGLATKFASFFISGMTSHLAKSGVKIGISIGTPYLFTREIVKTKAITKIYQDVILKQEKTIIVGHTVGLMGRTARTPFSEKMLRNEQHWLNDKISLPERKALFEKDNFGSLLIGAKGFIPNPEKKSGVPEIIHLNDDDQLKKGNFSTGDSLIIFNSPLSIKNLHQRIFKDKKYLFTNLNSLEIFSSPEHQVNDEIAIIGMGGVFPDAPDMNTLWDNIISKKYSIKKAPRDRFDWNSFYDEDKSAEDKSYSRLAGVIDDFKFDFKKFGYSEQEGNNLSRSQQIILTAAYQAVENAGYLKKKKLPGNRTTVVIASCLMNELSNDVYFKYFYPELKYYLENITDYNQLDDESKNKLLKKLKDTLSNGHKNDKSTDFMINFEASRIADFFKISGANYVVDAACASSISALDAAVKSLLNCEYDYAVVGGLNSNLAPEIFIGFSKINAVSDDGSFPFDKRANGFVLGEGAGVVVLKRMRDAVRDSDNILGIIKGIGSSSDGKGKAIAAPKAAGQELAIRRCYENSKSDLFFDDVQYIEAHGTSTTVGDATEIDTLYQIFKENYSVGISSIKSQIGHLLGGAGIAGLLKVLLSFKNKTLPPNGLFENLSPDIGLKEPLYIIDEPLPWKLQKKSSVRRAGVSSFGFGGINYHTVLEEYSGKYKQLERKIFNNPDYNFTNDKIVLVGLGCILPGAQDIDGLWSVINNNKTKFSDIPEKKFHSDYYETEEDPHYRLPHLTGGVIKNHGFNNLKYRIPPYALSSIDYPQVFALDAASQAIEQAKIERILKAENKVAVILGNTMGGGCLYQSIIRVRTCLLEKAILQLDFINEKNKKGIIDQLGRALKKRYPKTNENTIPGYLPNIISARIANFFNCNSANFIVDASGTSSAIATNLAIKGLQSGEFDYVISGGAYSNYTPAVLKADMDSEKQDIINPSEGAAVYILTHLNTAIKNNMKIIAEISPYGISAGVKDHSLQTRDKTALKNAIDNFYTASSIRKQQVNYLETSTNTLSPMELDAIDKCFKNKISFGNMTSTMGQLFSCNPAAAILRLALICLHSTIPSGKNSESENSVISKKSHLSPVKEDISFERNENIILAANHFGWGGNSCHSILKKIPQWITNKGNDSDQNQTQKLFDLESFDPEQSPKRNDDKKIVLLLSGQGSQYVGMMKELYNYDETIRFTMDEGDKIFKRIRGYSILDIIFKNAQLLNLTINTQPAIFLSSAAIYNSLHNKGLKADYFIGHSLGEFTALYCSGILDFIEALKLVIKRSDLMHQTAIDIAGSMVAVFKNVDETRELIKNSSLKYVYVANINSDNQTVVSGENYKINQFIEYLKKEEVPFKKINVSAAFHTPLFLEASKELRDSFESFQFNKQQYGTTFSNVTGEPYPENLEEVKNLLELQMVSAVNFVKTIKNVSLLNAQYFIEIGPKMTLSNMVNNMNIKYTINMPVVYKKYGEVKSFNKLLQALTDLNIIQTPQYKGRRIEGEIIDYSLFKNLNFEKNEFSEFLSDSKDTINNLVLEEFKKYKKEKEEIEYKKLNIYAGNIVVSGVSVGLPGSGHSVFNRENFNKILEGTSFIEELPETEKYKILDKKITRLNKSADGSAQFQKVDSVDDVIQLAAKLGYFDLKKEYNIDYDYDITFSLGIAAGIEALKDANIPLVMQFKNTKSGSLFKEGLALPATMQDNTGVIFTSLFSGFETIIDEVSRYYEDKNKNNFNDMHSYLMQNIEDGEEKNKISKWFSRFNDRNKNKTPYQFNRKLFYNILSLGASHFAQIIKAKGPNTQLSGSCASTTQAICVAEDWIKTNRCDRVIIISADAGTSSVQNEWIGSGLFALGVASNKKKVSEAATPFGSNRNGLILGSGAVALIIEKQDEVLKRGLNGQAQVLGTYIGNSAYHVSRLDGEHLSGEVKKFFQTMEQRHHLHRDEYVRNMLFMSHETYTPAAGGSAESEILALKKSFPKEYKHITISNTKGYTGNTLGAAIEDAVLVKALQKNRAPAIANLTVVPDEFRDLNFSNGLTSNYEYGVHLAAGFGSQVAIFFIKRLAEKPIKNNEEYLNWLRKISNYENPKLQIINHCLSIDPDTTKPSELISPQQTASSAMTANEGTKRDKAIAKVIQNIIAEQTGYTIDMLEEQLDFEADLGIDTVKQVQIFGKISNTYKFEVPEDLKLNKLNSISKLISFVKKTLPDNNEQSGKKIDVSIENTIKEIICVQTGYSSDMIENNYDFEADLGIDTVKQVQIFGKISSQYKFEVPENLKLNKLNTVEKLAEYVISLNKSDSSQKTAIRATDNAPIKTTIEEEYNKNIKRYIISLKKAELPTQKHNIFLNKKILISKDKYGFADEVIKLIKKNRGTVFTIGQNKDCDYVIDPAGREKIEIIAEDIVNAVPAIHGFIHLFPLDFYFDETSLVEAQSIKYSIKLFFLLIKQFHNNLHQKDSILAALSFNSVIFPYEQNPKSIYPVFAGIAGMLKTVNKEFPGTYVKIVDFKEESPLGNVKKIAACYISELMAMDNRVETGYKDGEKYILSLNSKSVLPGDSIIQNGDTILITGGARGITFEIVKAIAGKYRAKLILLGRTDINSIEKKYFDEFADEPTIFKDLKNKMQGETPLNIKKAAKKILKAQTIYKNLKELQAINNNIFYEAVDILNPDSINQIVTKYNKIDGIINAAGIDESNFINKKSLSSFNLVFDTKVSGALNLLDTFKNRDYRFVITFSSVSAKFGNEGQIDYTAANDMIEKILLKEQYLNPEKKYKIFDWTAWKGTGMANNETVLKVLSDKGFDFLSIGQGVKFFMDELYDDSEYEVVITGQNSEFDIDGLILTDDDQKSGYPFLDNKIDEQKDKVTFNRVLDLDRDIFLKHHIRKGVPLFLGAAGLETMAEAAASAADNNKTMVEINDFIIPYGIKILKKRPKEIFIEALYGNDRKKIHCTIKSVFRNKEGILIGDPTLHYKGTYIFAEKYPEPEKIELPKFNGITTSIPLHDLLYHPERLFLGKLFMSIDDILFCDERMAVVVIKNRSEKIFFHPHEKTEFITNVIINDALFQTAAIIELFNTSVIALPYKISSMKFFAKTDPNGEYICITKKINEDNEMINYQIDLLDKDKKLVIRIDSFTMIKIEKISDDFAIKNKLKNNMLLTQN